MYFDLTDEQQAIKSTAKEFLASRYKSERIRALAESEHGFEDSDWREMAELGWPGLALPEEWGGQGLGIVDLAVLFEEMGYALAPSPLLSNTVAGLVLATVGDDAQRERWLAPLASGEKRGTIALFEAGSSATIGDFGMEAEQDGDGVVLDGDEGAGDGRGERRLPRRRHRRRPPPPGRARRRRASRSPPRSRSTSPAASTRCASTASAWRPRRRSPAARRTTCRCSGAPARRSPPSRPGSPSGRWRWRSSTPRTASSSAARSAPTRRSRTAARRCCWRPRTRDRPSTAPPGPPTPSPSRCRWPPRWPRHMPPTPAGGCPTPRSRCTAGSASPGSTTCTSSSSAARPTRRPSAPRAGTASGSPTSSSREPPPRR